MSQRLIEPGFENATPAWTFFEGATRTQEAALAGSWGASVLGFEQFVAGFPPTTRTVNGRVEQSAPTQPGKIYRLALLVALVSTGAAIELCVENQPGVVEVLARLEDWNAAIGVRHVLSAEVEAVSSSMKWIARAEHYGDLGATGIWSIDEAVLGDPSDQEELMSGNLETLLANVKSVIEAADANIGTVFLTTKRWKSQKELSDAAAFTIRGAGEFDDEERRGLRVLRFWAIDARTAPERLTNKTEQYRHELRVRGFYQHEDDTDQGVALRQAGSLILEKLLEQELGSLAANMGDGYDGFLTDPPVMVSEVQTAMLGGNGFELQGFVLELRIVAYEEVRH